MMSRDVRNGGHVGPLIVLTDRDVGNGRVAGSIHGPTTPAFRTSCTSEQRLSMIYTDVWNGGRVGPANVPYNAGIPYVLYIRAMAIQRSSFAAEYAALWC